MARSGAKASDASLLSHLLDLCVEGLAEVLADRVGDREHELAPRQEADRAPVPFEVEVVLRVDR